jgi:hypothetical protein
LGEIAMRSLNKKNKIMYFNQDVQKKSKQIQNSVDNLLLNFFKKFEIYLYSVYKKNIKNINFFFNKLFKYETTVCCANNNKKQKYIFTNINYQIKIFNINLKIHKNINALKFTTLNVLYRKKLKLKTKFKKCIILKKHILNILKFNNYLKKKLTLIYIKNKLNKKIKLKKIKTIPILYSIIPRGLTLFNIFKNIKIKKFNIKKKNLNKIKKNILKKLIYKKINKKLTKKMQIQTNTKNINKKNIIMYSNSNDYVNNNSISLYKERWGFSKN